MKRFIALVTTFALFASLIAGTSHQVQANAAPQLLSGILQKMESAHRNLKSLKAPVVFQRVNSQLGTRDSDYGTLLYKPGAGGARKFKIEFNKPDTRVLSLTGQQVVYYQPRINQVFKNTIDKLSKGRSGNYSVLAALDGSVKSLESQYSFEYVKEELVNGKTATQLHLTPKGKGQYKSIDIWVSHELWLPVQYKFVDRNDDYTVVKFSNMEINVKVADGDFNVKYPSGTAVVDKL